MAQPAADVEGLIALMARLPGLGPRSARRAVLHLVKKRGQLLLPLADALRHVGETARDCVNCGNIGTADLCPICADPRRLNGQVCVVEDVSDLWAMERTGQFRGRYHVLGGTLSALDQVGPDDLRVPRLLERVGEEEVTEVILALGATVDGQTTALYLADRLAGAGDVPGGAPGGVAVTTLAQGVPVGGELDYLDEGTIGAALKARRAL